MNSTMNCFPAVSIIILNFNGKAFLDDCLESVLQTDYPQFEIILVDNGSSDGSADYIMHTFQDNVRVKIMLLDRNYGYAYGNNLGALLANKKSKFLVFLNNDVKVDKYWLKELVKVMELDKSIGAAQAKLLIMGKNRIIDSAGGFISRIGQPIICGKGKQDRGQYDYVQEIFYSKGAAMIVRRNLWQALRGFDPQFFLYWEETDFCWRARLIGYKIVFVPDSVVYHACGAAIKKYFSSLISFYDSRNRILTLASNYGLKNLCKYIPTTLIWNLASSIIKTLKIGSSFPVLYEAKSISWCLTHLKFIVQRRKYIQTHVRKQSDEQSFRAVMTPSFVFRGSIYGARKVGSTH